MVRKNRPVESGAAQPNVSSTLPAEELLHKIFDGAREGLRAELAPQEYEKLRHDFVFHLSEVRDDAARLAALLTEPDKLDEATAATLLIGILYHAIPHLNAAGRLLLDRISDPFAPS